MDPLTSPGSLVPMRAAGTLWSGSWPAAVDCVPLTGRKFQNQTAASPWTQVSLLNSYIKLIILVNTVILESIWTPEWHCIDNKILKHLHSNAAGSFLYPNFALLHRLHSLLLNQQVFWWFFLMASSCAFFKKNGSCFIILSSDEMVFIFKM